jgi:hypothetical protein
LSNVSSDALLSTISGHTAELEGARLFIALLTNPRVDATAEAALAIASSADALALMEIASWLGRGGQIPPPHRSGLGKAFLLRAGDRSDVYGSRAHALKAAMIMAQTDRSLLRRLQADLLELDPSDDGVYLRHAARIAGAILAHDPDDDLRTVLATLIGVEEANDEAAFELGLDCVRRGLEATTPDAALAAFETARGWFARAEEAAETRIDATLYRCCLDVLVDFQASRFDTSLPKRIEAVCRTAFAYAAFLTVSDREPESASWLCAEELERIHWSSLALRLGALADKVSRAAWLKTAEVLEDELLSIYSASRTLFRRAADGGLEAVVRPAIVGAFQRELRSIAILEQWIEENAELELAADAKRLLVAVKEVRENLIAHRPLAAAAGSSPTAALLERLPEPTRSTVSARIEANGFDLLDQTVSRTVDDTLRKVTNALEANVDYKKDDVRRFFDVLLLHVTRFVVSRYNLSVATFPGVKYLFEGKANAPLEVELQKDFINFLMGSPLSSICTPEARDLGGGRVDVLFSYQWMKTTSELKRSFPQRTLEGLIDEYGPQTISYQGTNISLSILMVLDLFDRKGIQPDIRDQIDVHFRAIAESAVEHAVVIFRIQGLRKTPSATGAGALTLTPAQTDRSKCKQKSAQAAS